MDTLFDYLDGAVIAIEPLGEDAARERFKQIADYYEARREAMEHPGGARSTSRCRPTGCTLPKMNGARISARRRWPG